MLERQLQPTLQRFANAFPVVAITGSRQSGKTTLARRFFSGLKYVSLEDPSELAFRSSTDYLSGRRNPQCCYGVMAHDSILTTAIVVNKKQCKGLYCNKSVIDFCCRNILYEGYLTKPK